MGKLFRCKQCDKEVNIKSKSYGFLIEKRGYVFCSKKCSGISRRRGGFLRYKTEKTNIEKYGTAVPANSDTASCSIKERNIEKYGVEYYFQSEEFKKNVKQTWLKNLGVDSPFKLQRIHEKGILAAATKESRDKAQITYRMHYDVNPIQHAIEKTYGVSNISQTKQAKSWLNTPEACKKREETIRSKDGYIIAAQKCHETMKKNGTYATSRPENDFYVFLRKTFNVVNRQVRINNWNIDFYISDIDTYVQLDGVYWHGLDRPIEIIEQKRNKRDQTILNHRRVDQLQNKWFVQNGKKFVRITDVEFKTSSQEDLLKKIVPWEIKVD